jgi:ABC-2 type transport system ATP-binding protein
MTLFPPPADRPSADRPGTDRPSTDRPGADPPALAIRARGLDKVYRRRRTPWQRLRGVAAAPPVHALRGIDLDVPRGALFGLLGPNGAGKSTFINILAGLVVKTGGRAAVWGLDIDAAPRAARAAIGVVPQELSLDPFFSAREALELQAGYYGVPPAERRTMAILERVGLAAQADASPRTLSGGMRRRLLVAKALVHNPPVLVLDEPTAGVDIELRRQLWDFVRELNAAGTTVVLTTHYLEEAEALCDRIAIIDRGEVVACAPTRELVGRLDDRSVRLTLAAPLDPAAPPPDALRGFHVDRPDARTLVLRYRSHETKIADLLAAVAAAGLAIADLTTEEPDLEDVFLELTRRNTP